MTPVQPKISGKLQKLQKIHAAEPLAGTRVLALLMSEASLTYPNKQAIYPRKLVVCL